MRTITKDKLFKILLVLLLVVSVIPMGSLSHVFAEAISNYTVTLTDGTDTLKVDEISVTLTEKDDENNKLTTSTSQGIATFNNFVEKGKIYSVDIIGYDSESTEITVGDEPNINITVTKIDQKKISGVITDHNGQPYKDAVIQLNGYTSQNIVTTEEGKYTLSVYKGKDYQLNIKPNQNDVKKYEEKSFDYSNISDDIVNNQQFVLKTYKIETEIDSQSQSFGIITPTIEKKYGDNFTVNISANDGYRIRQLMLDNEVVSKATGQKNYSLSLEKIDQSHKIVVEFQAQEYKITLEVNENGTLQTENTTITAGGEILSVLADTDMKITAQANDNYHIRSFKIDSVDQISKELNSIKSSEYTIQDIDKDYLIEVIFAIDTYSVQIENSDDEKGTVKVTADKVEHNASYDISVTPQEGYHIKSLMVNEKEVTFDEGNLGNDYIAEVSSVTMDQKVSIEYETDKAISFNESGISFDIDTSTPSEIYDENDLKTYVYPKETSVKLKTTKSGLKINDIGDRDTSSQTFQTQILIEKTDSNQSLRVYDKDQHQWFYVILDKSIRIDFDGDSPELSNIVKNIASDWTNQSIEVSGNVYDSKIEGQKNSKVYQVRYSKDVNTYNSDDKNNISSDVLIATLTNDTFTFTISDNEEYDGKYYIWAYDKAGNKSECAEIDIRIDKTKPAVDEFIFSSNQQSDLENFINFLTFGTFYKESIYVTVKTSDVQSSVSNSGIGKLELKAGDQVLTPQSYDLSTGIFVYKLEKDLFKDGQTLSAVVVDNAGNASESKQPLDVQTNLQNNSIVLNEGQIVGEITSQVKENSDNVKYTNSKNEDWYKNDSAFINFKVKDSVVGLYDLKVYLSHEGDTEQELLLDDSIVAFNNEVKANKVIDEKNVYIDTVGKLKPGKNIFKFIVTNNSTFTQEYTYALYLDESIPEVTNFDIEHEGATPLEKVLNFLTFGMFFDDKVTITVSTNDAGASAGVKEITLYKEVNQNLEILATENVDGSGKATFILPSEDILKENIYFDGVIKASVKDNVEKESDIVLATTVNSDIQNSGLMIETIKPIVEVDFIDPSINKNANTANSNDWYNDDVDFNIHIEDNESGIRNVEVKINDTVISTDKNNKNILEEFYKYTTKTTELDFVVNTNQVPRNEDGSYNLEINVIDNAGNVSEQYQKVIYKDIDNPFITGFHFETKEYIEGSETETNVIATDYGFYFKEDTKVVISSKDITPSSGIKSIIYYTVDIEKGKSLEKTQLVNENGEISIIIPANFKGQIYAKATDNVDNTSDKFVTPNSTIVESPDLHKKDQHITFDKAETDLTDRNGKELYGNNVPLTITVSDTYSGIRSVEWTVKAPYDSTNNQAGEVTIDNSKKLSGDSNWNITKTELNLITEMKKTINVNNNSNDIVITVKMTDRAGNTTTKDISFSIDKTSPTIEVTYDNNDADPIYKDIYKADRTATIVITERNFKADDVNFKITNTDNVIPNVDLSSHVWTEQVDTKNPDKTTYTAKISYTSDGDYTFDIAYEDNAKNKAADFATDKFTIDKTIPTVSVSYDNHSALKDNYYKADRVATITIVEHNFDASRVNIIGTATDNGTTITFPSLSSWINIGDMHIATIHYANDAEYTFDIEFMDMARNNIIDYTMEKFFIDKTAPTLEISGVEDNSANNGDVSPVVTISDTNYDRNAITISLSGYNNGRVNYDGAFSDITNGQTFTYANFKKEQKVDDIYTLSAKIVDMAGNETEKTITFSANRFGSVYTFDNTLSEIAGKYISEERNIIFTETNVDSLNRDSIKVKLTKNGVPTDLVENNDYVIGTSGGNGKWSQYQYTLSKKLFEDEGRYSIAVYSTDRAGNTNENIDEVKKAEIAFGIDKTKPVIVPIDFENNKQYDIELKKAEIEIKDNLVLQNVDIYLDNEKVDYANNEELYTINIPEKNYKQTVKIVAVDAAGNTETIEVKDFLVSTNFFVRWYNNTPLFVGTIMTTVAVIGGLFIILLKRRKKDEETDQSA